MRRNFKFILPFSGSIWNNTENELVNVKNRWVDERGVTAIIIDPSMYSGREMMQMKVI